MKKTLFSLLFGVAFFGIALLADAEVPKHNPDLDHKCGPGFQWSRGPVACKQANCPPGAGRTYVYDCSCGEAWDKPFRTCYGDVIGLVTHCVSKDQSCDDVTPGFDVVSGECKTDEGFKWNADKSDCIREYPEKMKCKIVDPQGNPLTNTEITFGEYTTNMTGADSSQKVTSNSSGEVEVTLSNRGAKMVKFIFRGDGPNHRAIHEVSIDDAYGKECKVVVVSNDKLEKFIKDGYIKLLKDACLTEDQLDKIRNAKIQFRDDITNSNYDPENKILNIAASELTSDWEGLQRTVVHEFGHFISDNIIDPSSWYIKGYPLFGKYTGGSHDNWTPSGTNGSVDGQQLAFEEGMADFIAHLYFEANGLGTYQENLITDERAQQAIDEHGANQAGNIESVITSFLIKYYGDMIRNDGAGKTLGNFIQATTYADRNDWFGDPARTIKEWIVGRNRSYSNDPVNDCTPTASSPDLAQLANDFGFNGGDRRIRLVPRTSIPDANGAVSEMPFQNSVQPTFSINNMIPIADEIYQFGPDAGIPVFIDIPDDYASTGNMGRVTFGPEMTNEFSVNSDGLVYLLEGEAMVNDTDILLPNLTVNHTETEYLVSVKDGVESVSVVKGSVEAVEKEGEQRRVTLAEGEKTEFTTETGFSEPTPAEEAIEEFTESMPDEMKVSSASSEKGLLAFMNEYFQVILIGGIGLIILILILMLFKKKKA